MIHVAANVLNIKYTFTRQLLSCDFEVTREMQSGVVRIYANTFSIFRRLQECTILMQFSKLELDFLRQSGAY